MLRIIARFIKVLNSEAGPGQLSAAFCLSMVAGLTPFFSVHNLLVIFLVMILRINVSAFMLGLMFFTGMSYALDPVFHRIGLWALTLNSLEGIWTAMYNSTLMRLEHFNNTINMGSLIFSLSLFAPAYFISNVMVRKYRQYVLEWTQRFRIVQVIKGTKLYSVYRSISDIGGER